MKTLELIARQARNDGQRPWAIWPEALGMEAGDEAALTAENLAASNYEKGGEMRGGTLVIPVQGIIVQRAPRYLSGYYAGLDGIAEQLRAGLASADVAQIVLDIDSPGGSVAGVEELAAEVFAARAEKPIIAVANSLMASAAYWIGSAATEVVAAPSSQVGSIGVISVHEDYSQMLETMGVSVTLISAGRYKTEGNMFEPLDEEARAAIQADVDAYYQAFVNQVARHRGVAPNVVRSGFGEGRVLVARTAVAEGMADRVATLNDVLGISSSRRGRRRGAGADMDLRQRRWRLAQQSAPSSNRLPY